MRYEIKVDQGQDAYEVTVYFYDDTNAIVLTGCTSVCVDSIEAAQEYALAVFIPDLQRNFKVLQETDETETASEQPAPEVILDGQG